MKVTFFIGSLYGGGAERVTCNLANYLVQQGHEAEILTMSETDQAYEIDEKVTTKTLLELSGRRGKLWNTVVRFPRLWNYIKKNPTDAYIVMLPKTTILLLAVRWIIKAKVVVAERADPKAYRKQISNMLRRYASRADGWVFQTDDARNWYGDAITKCKSIVIPNAINPVFIRPRYESAKRKRIAGVGRLNDQKNFSLLINAFAIIAPDFPDYNLTIYGKGDKEAALKELVSNLGLRERVEFPGNIQNIADEVEKSAMFVLSSNFEGMPNALMEAMALGLPCISTDCPCGGPRYLIQNDKNGILVPVGDIQSMAKAMREILSSPRKAESLGEEARKIADRLEPGKIYGQWEQFICSLVETKEDS